jgi:arginase
MQETDRLLIVIDAPSNLGLRPPAPGKVPGVYRLPAALRRWGLVERIGAEDGGCLQPTSYAPEWYPGFGVRNAEAIRDYSISLADRIGEAVADGAFPVVLGGDCSILLGNALALRRRGRYGLAYLDGHLDFRHPGNATAVGAAAGEDLALVTGRGGERLTNIDGLAPYVHDADVVALGEREGDEETSDILDTEITVWNLTALRRIGMHRAARLAIERFEDAGVDGFWIHLDADVLDDRVMPAVDSPQPDGLSYGELTALVAPLLASDLAVGMEITIFDPDLDPDGAIAQGFVDALVNLFSPVRSHA